MQAYELEVGQYYWDFKYHLSLIFRGQEGDYCWFYCQEESRHVAYYEWELENLRRY